MLTPTARKAARAGDATRLLRESERGSAVFQRVEPIPVSLYDHPWTDLARDRG